MSKQRALKAINLLETDRIPCMEWLDHPEFVKEITGIDPFIDPANAILKGIKKLDLDWYISIPKKSFKFNDNETKKELAEGQHVSEWGFTGSFWKKEFSFHSDEEVLEYNPFKDGYDEAVSRFRKDAENAINSVLHDQTMVGDSALVTGLYYTVLFQWFILTFGWEMFLVTAGAEHERFKDVIDVFTQISVLNAEEWAKTNVPVFFCHDDLAITRGLVFPPEWYRQNIFPNYEKIFDSLKKSGKKIIFVSDGNYGELIDDIFATGVDGVMLDNYVDIDAVIEKYGKSKVIIGNVDTRILTNGSLDDIFKEVKRCIDLGKRYPGYFIRASGDLPHNIPIENIKYYFKLCSELGKR